MAPADTESGLIAQARTGELHLDFLNASFVTPYVLALAAILTDIAQAQRVPVRFTSPANSEVARYASRMHLGQFLSSSGIRHALPLVHETDRADRLCELRRFSTHEPSACQQLAELTATRCDRAGLAARVADDLAAQVYEVCNNAYAHAQCDHAYLCAQTYTDPEGYRVELVVADGGRGIQASLAGTEYGQRTAELAIKAAVERRITSIGRPDHHGIGLANLRRFTTDGGGTMTIRSGGALVSFGSAGSARIYRVAELSGTVVSCSLHFRA